MRLLFFILITMSILCAMYVLKALCSINFYFTFLCQFYGSKISTLFIDYSILGWMFRRGVFSSFVRLSDKTTWYVLSVTLFQVCIGFPDSKVHGANMGPIWNRQDQGGPHVGPMNFAIWEFRCQIIKFKFMLYSFQLCASLLFRWIPVT